MNHGKQWTPAEDAKLARLYPCTDNEKLAREFGRSELSVSARARNLRIRKSADYLKSIRPVGRTYRSPIHPLELAFRFLDKYERTIPTPEQVKRDFGVGNATAYRWIRRLKDARGIA